MEDLALYFIGADPQHPIPHPAFHIPHNLMPLLFIRALFYDHFVTTALEHIPVHYHTIVP